jgi:hypothetical protein
MDGAVFLTRKDRKMGWEMGGAISTGYSKSLLAIQKLQDLLMD